MADRSPDRSWYRLRWSRPAPDLRAVRLECKRCAMLRYSSSNPAPAVALGTPSVSNLVVIPVPPSPSPSLTDVLVRARRPLGLNLLPRIEPKPRPDVDAVKILRDAAKQRRKNGEKFSTMAPGRGPQAAAQAPVRGVRQPGERAGRRGRRRSRRPAATAAARVDAAARRTRRPTAAAREPRRLDPSGAEPASSSPPAVRVQPEPARRLRYVVPPKDADKENADKEKAPGKANGTRGSKPRSKSGPSPTRTSGRSRRRFAATAPRTGEATATATAARRRSARGGRQVDGPDTEGRAFTGGGTRRSRAGFQEGPEGESPGGGRRRRRHPEHATGDDRRL